MTRIKAGWGPMAAVVAMSASATIAPPASASPTVPPMPDLRSFTTVQARTDDSGTYFRTTDGLHCKMKDEYADCVGSLPGTAVPANAISLGNTVSAAGPGYGGSFAGVRLSDGGSGASIDKFGDEVPTVRPGEKVVGPGSECAVAATDAGERTMCTVGRPVRQWLVVSPTGTGIGPATSGLPAGYPEPVSFVQGYASPANVRFPSTFIVDGPTGDLTCRMSFSSVTPPLRCEGDLPGTEANEVSFDQTGVARVAQTRFAQFDGTNNGPPAPRLPVGYRTPYPGTCLAIVGGIACYDGAGSEQSPLHGFKIDTSGVTTF